MTLGRHDITSILETDERQLACSQIRAASKGNQNIAIFTHNREGGVLHHVKTRSARYTQEGVFVILLRPGPNSDSCEVTTNIENNSKPISFFLPREFKELRSFLVSINLKSIEVHHFIGHNTQIFDLIKNSGVPYDVFVHDYSWICPRITLTTEYHRYCGEPNISECMKCVAKNGTNIDESISPKELRVRSMQLLTRARSIIVPSTDVSKRITMQTGLNCFVQPWDQVKPVRLPASNVITRRKKRVCVVGAIGFEKGYYTLLEMAIIIAKSRLPMELIIVGYTCEDRPLLETGSVTIIGRYDEERVVGLIREQKADVGFLPAQWPETWSYTLSQMWDAGLFVVAYDIGTPSERIKSNQGGMVIPLHLPTSRLVSLLLGLPFVE